MKVHAFYLAGVAVALVLSALAYEHTRASRRLASVLTISGLHGEYIPGDELLGGGATVADTAVTAYGRSVKNIVREHWRDFYQGKVPFTREWDIPSDGTRPPLGPFFNALSCERCHEHDGRGQPPYKPGEVSESMVVHLSIVADDGSAVPDPVYGDQLHLYGAGGTAGEGIVDVVYDEVLGEYAEGGSYTLMKPEYKFRHLRYGPLHPDIRFSPRVAPFNFGLGLLELIPGDDILAHADPDDRNKDGVSGRPNIIREIKSGEMMLGRFGWKASQPTIEQQVARAFSADLGITSALYPAEVLPPEHPATAAPGRPELDQEEFGKIITYIRLLAVPRQRDWEQPAVMYGKALFTRIGCAGCHVSRFQTGSHPLFPELSHQVIHPYTDLLLHDMGEGLADDRPDGLATGREWRTPPLWGIGLVENVSRHTRFLHDGRARNIEEAILWHGGEAAASQELYRRLRHNDRTALLAFLESL